MSTIMSDSRDVGKGPGRGHIFFLGGGGGSKKNRNYRRNKSRQGK